MRIGKEELEKLFGFLANFLGTRGFEILQKVLRFFEKNSQNSFARMRKRIFSEIEKIESKRKLTREDKIKLKVLWDVMKMIEEEQLKFSSEIFSFFENERDFSEYKLENQSLKPQKKSFRKKEEK